MLFYAGLLHEFLFCKCFGVFMTFSGSLLKATNNGFSFLLSKPLNLQALERIWVVLHSLPIVRMHVLNQ